MRSRGLGAVWAVVVLWALCSGGAVARVVLPAPGQPMGALSGRVVFMSAGHGWTFSNSSGKWFTQRGDSNEIVEDYGNLDQMNLFAAYCFNAGATVVAFRPIGDQTNEVVLDNVSSGVSFQGAWSDSTATSQYFGRAGELAYRFAGLAATETATATYTPNVPEAGLYPVYAWAAHGANRTFQLYRVRHTGGEATVRVPHHLVGNGWVYLGSYYFQRGSNAQSGAVVISNLQPTPSLGSVVIADAIRFGNGMGDVSPVLSGGGAGTVSGYPREEECARYWVQRMVGVGAPTSIYDSAGLDDSSDNVGAPPRMAREMNRENGGEMADRVFVSFHSNASGVSPPPDNARGCIGLYNSESLFPGTATPNQQRLAYLIASEMNAELSAQTSPPLEVPWFSRPDNQLTFARGDFAFGEINNSAISDEFDATIIEVGFHDHPDDALLLRDPRVRSIMARTACEGVVRYMHEFGGVPLVFAPAPPANVRAVAVDGGVRLSWSAPGTAEGGLATGYVVYRSTNGFGFGQPVRVSGAGVTSLVLTNLSSDQAWYFRVAATNAGGESMPSETAGYRAGPGQPRVLFVNAFDRFERTLNVRQTVGPGLAGPAGGGGTFDRLKLRRMNSFDYVVPHGEAMSRCGVAFDSCQNEAVASGAVLLTNYAAVIWACGEESTADETFSVVEQVRLTNYLASGGRLLVSGSEIAWDLDRDSGPTSADRNFLRTQLHAALLGNLNDDAGTSFVDAIPGGIFSGNAGARFDEGNDGVYAVRFPDVLTPVGAAAIAALRYAGGLGGAAAVQHADEATGSRVVYFGFPFETLATATMREACLFDVMSYFGVIPAPRLAVSPEMDTGHVELSWGALPGRKYQLQFQESLGGESWQNLGGAFVAGGQSASVRLLMAASQRFYRVVIVD